MKNWITYIMGTITHKRMVYIGRTVNPDGITKSGVSLWYINHNGQAWMVFGL